MKQYRNADDPLDGAAVVLIGLFSANEKLYETRLDHLATLIEALGGRVVGRYVQRRGACDRWKERPGGAALMSLPFSRRTLLTHGKIREIAAECQKNGVGAAIFVNTLTSVQRTALTRLLGCSIFSADDLRP